MSNWLMNRLFNTTTHFQHSWWSYYVGSHLSTTGAQVQLVKDLNVRE